MFRRICSLVVLLLVLSFAHFAQAMTVYMMDDSEMEAQEAWKEGDNVYLRVDGDTVLTLPASEVNLAKSGVVIQPARKTGAAPARRAALPEPRSEAEVVDQLIEVAGFRRDLNDLFGRIGRGETEELLAQTFSPAMAEQPFKRSLKRKLSHVELNSVLKWYKSPLGYKVVEAESVWVYNGKEKRLTYVRLESVPGHRERMNLAREIDRETGVSEVEAREMAVMLRKMMKSIPSDFPDAKEIKARIEKEIPKLKDTRKENVEKIAYAYRYFSLGELHEYLRFLRSPIGRKYMAAVREATEALFQKVAINMEKDFRQEVRLLK
ncbi:MAG TPA: DUF2059 domain-containing protein [Geomonas sp.]|nr:DUF2059 domain-containing protein [Geomonas sp.]